MAENKLYVGNLSFNTTEEQLTQLFLAFGSVGQATIVQDRETGRSRGFAFVTMGSEQEAKAAINGLDGKTVDGRAIQVNVARPKENGGGGGGGGGRGRW
jgi:RNA recognition motif-containing protein